MNNPVDAMSRPRVCGFEAAHTKLTSLNCLSSRGKDRGVDDGLQYLRFHMRPRVYCQRSRPGAPSRMALNARLLADAGGIRDYLPWATRCFAAWPSNVVLPAPRNPPTTITRVFVIATHPTADSPSCPGRTSLDKDTICGNRLCSNRLTRPGFRLRKPESVYVLTRFKLYQVLLPQNQQRLLNIQHCLYPMEICFQ